jgi:hypothetical protein
MPCIYRARTIICITSGVPRGIEVHVSCILKCIIHVQIGPMMTRVTCNVFHLHRLRTLNFSLANPPRHSGLIPPLLIFPRILWTKSDKAPPRQTLFYHRPSLLLSPPSSPTRFAPIFSCDASASCVSVRLVPPINVPDPPRPTGFRSTSFIHGSSTLSVRLWGDVVGSLPIR